MDIELSVSKALPGEKCTIDITASPNSFVALLGVDESVTLLSSGNDVDEKRINSAFEAVNVPALKVKGNKDRYQDIGESNAFILTNALTGFQPCVYSRFNTEYSDSDEEENIDSEEDLREEAEEEDFFAVEESYEVSESKKMRKAFMETWIFEDFKKANTRCPNIFHTRFHLSLCLVSRFIPILVLQ